MFTQTEEQKISLTLEEFLDWYPDGYSGFDVYSNI